MKENLVKIGAVILVTAVVIAGFVIAAVSGFTAGQAQASATVSHGHSSCDERLLEHLPSTLNITVDQLDGVRRITERAKPQLVAIRTDARQKRQAIMDATMHDIVPLLTPKQQKKLEDLQKAREEEHRAKQKVREVLQTPSLFESK